MSRATHAAIIFFMAVAAALTAKAMSPDDTPGNPGLNLNSLVPEKFSAWQTEPDPTQQVLLVPNAATEALEAQAASYDSVLMRTYQRRDGARVMIALAYGSRQTQEIKIHRPELCYFAQGFEVRSLGTQAVTLAPDRTVTSRTLLTRNRQRLEVVSYWIRLGDEVVNDPWAMRWQIFRAGLAGRIPDGMLVRVSTFASQPDAVATELQLHRQFLADLFRALSPDGRYLIAGGAETAS